MPSRSTRRGTFAVAVLGLSILALRPVDAVERALDFALLPTRLLAEAARPVRWLQRGELLAAESALSAREERDFQRRQEFFRESARSATPDPARFPARRFVHAEVVDRDPAHIDHVVVELEGGSCAGLVEGLPVVSGEVYAGRLERIDQPLPGQAIVALITGRDAFVGARIEPDVDGAAGAAEHEPARLVVGGVVSVRGDPGREARPDRCWLAVHNPSQSALEIGRVVVDEGPEGALGHGALANGFELGRLRENGGDERRPSYAVEQLLDYRAGLFQLAIVCPPDLARGAETPLLDVLEDPEGWRGVLVTSSFEPAAWRAGLKVGGGTWDGIRAGAAVVSGVHLIGRVKRASLASADVALLADPGLHVPALARIEGREALVLGSLAAVGSGASRSPGKPGGSGASAGSGGSVVRMLWNAEAPRTVDAPVRAEILTGSGEPRVPRGLLLGETVLPAGEGLHELELVLPVDTRDLESLWVRLDSPTERRAGGAGVP